MNEADLARIQKRLADYSQPLAMDAAIREHINLDRTPQPREFLLERPPWAPDVLAVVLMRRAASAAVHHVHEAELQGEIKERDRSGELRALMDAAAATEQVLDRVLDALVDTKQFDEVYAGRHDAGQAWINRLVLSYISSGCARQIEIGPPRSPADETRKARDDIETLLCARAILAAIRDDGSAVAANEVRARKPRNRPIMGDERAFVCTFAEAWTHCMGDWPSHRQAEDNPFLQFVRIAWRDAFGYGRQLTGAIKTLDSPSDYEINTMTANFPSWF